LEGLDFMNCCL
jgi:serine/threonine protein kinase